MKLPGHVDLSGAEGVQNLSPDEYTLCSSLFITPRVYFFMKKTVIQNAEQVNFK